jgi:hypothetical protein
MKRKRFGAVIAVFVLCFLASSVLWAESQARIVRLSLVDGSVELDRATGKGFEKAIVNMPITQGMRLRTSSDSNAEVEFESGSTLRLIGNTTVSFGRLSLGDDGGRLTAVNVEEGTAYFNVKQEPHDDFAISFAGREFRLTHSSHLRVDVSDSDVEVAMFKGEAEMAGNPDVRLTSDHSLAFRRGDQEQLADSRVTQGFTDEPSDSWDKQRQDYIDNSEAQIQRDNPPLSPGLYDLNAYGNYYNDPTYGVFWRPYGVSYGWDPFSNGAWVWYPGFGYTWVSSYPWGWAPYRYGNWTWLPTYGWVWQPGHWNNWWQGPVFANAPAGYYAPHPPRHHDHTVVWVGRPQPGWTPNFHPHHGDNAPMRTTIYDGGEGGGRQRVATAAPTNPGTTTRNIPANGLTGGAPPTNLNTTVPTDGQIIHRSDGPGPRGRNPIFVDHEGGVPRQGAAGTPVSPVVTPHEGAPVTPVGVPHETKPHPVTQVPQAGGRQPAPHDTGRPSTPHVDTPRRAPVAPPHAETPHAAPAPRMETPHATPAPHVETPHAAPAPHVEAPHMSAPRTEAPHMAAPHLEAPHMSAPHMSGGSAGGAAHTGGGGHSPR